MVETAIFTLSSRSGTMVQGKLDCDENMRSKASLDYSFPLILLGGEQ
jgi:hypothetical protein